MRVPPARQLCAVVAAVSTFALIAGVSAVPPAPLSHRVEPRVAPTPDNRPVPVVLTTFDGFGPPDVAAVAADLRQTVSPIYAGQLALDSGRPSYPTITVDAIGVDPVRYAAAVGRPELGAALRSGVVLAGPKHSYVGASR